MKTVEFLTEKDLILGDNTYLKKTFVVTEKDKENLSLGDLWIDCDYVKVNGENGRGSFPFIYHENKSKIYIISMFEIEGEEKEIISWWLNGAKNEKDINNNWDDWDKVKKGIAFRGGSGYVYALYAMELINE